MRGVGKVVLKKYLRKYFDDGFINRKKMGFGVPLSHWFKSDLFEYAKDIFSSPVSVQRGIVNADYGIEILKRHKLGKFDYSRRIWNLLFFEHWCRKWLD